MDENQRNWLIETFFKNEKYAGWRKIAEKLIDEGSCITTTQGYDIWVGGIGNFIKDEPFEGGVDLIRLTFNVKEFASKDNSFFMEYYNREIDVAKQKLQDAMDYSKSIIDLTKS